MIQKLEEAEVKKFVGHRFPEFSFSRIEEFGKTENDYTNTGIINYAKIIFLRNCFPTTRTREISLRSLKQLMILIQMLTRTTKFSERKFCK